MTDPYRVRMFAALAGGGFGALDSWDGDLLYDGFLATVITAAGVYWYRMNATSGAVTNSPFRIPPATNPGTKVWHLVGTTARIGALVKLTSDQTFGDLVGAFVAWDAAVYDDASFWSAGAATRLTIPIGVTGVKISSSCKWATVMSNLLISLVYKNGASGAEGTPQDRRTAVDLGSVNLKSPVLSVAAADYFESRYYHASGGDRDLDAVGETWFAIEAINFE